MKIRGISRILLLAATAAIALPVAAAEPDASRIGVYESRAVALAWGRSTQHNEANKDLMAEAKKAEAEGNKSALRRLRREGSSRQERLEKQVFGDDRIPDIIARIAYDLPGIQQQTGVARILDRRDAPSGVATLDVTSNLVALFHPTEKTLKMIEDIQKHPPIKHIPKH